MHTGATNDQGFDVLIDSLQLELFEFEMEILEWQYSNRLSKT